MDEEELSSGFVADGVSGTLSSDEEIRAVNATMPLSTKQFLSPRKIIPKVSGSCVWKHFMLSLDQKSAKCRYCFCVLQRTHFNTSSLLNHLRSKHQEVLKKVASKPTSSSATFTKTEFHFHLARMIAKDIQPLSIIKNEGFVAMVKFLNDQASFPSQRFLRNVIIPELYQEERDKLQQQLETQHICITTDGWTSTATQSYITVTVNWIDKDWKIQNKVLSTCELSGSHTGEFLAHKLSAIISDWKISFSQIAGVVTDNDAKYVKAIKDVLQWNHYRCYAHTLQLVIKDALSEVLYIGSLIDKFRAIVTHYHHSPKATSNLTEIQKTVGFKQPHKLITDTVTRWSSTWMLLNSCYQQQEALIKELSSSAEYCILLPKFEDWSTIKEICELLYPFKYVTESLQSENNLTISVILPMLAQIDKHLENQMPQSLVGQNFKVIIIFLLFINSY